MNTFRDMRHRLSIFENISLVTMLVSIVTAALCLSAPDSSSQVFLRWLLCMSTGLVVTAAWLCLRTTQAYVFACEVKANARPDDQVGKQALLREAWLMVKAVITVALGGCIAHTAITFSQARAIFISSNLEFIYILTYYIMIGLASVGIACAMYLRTRVACGYLERT